RSRRALSPLPPAAMNTVAPTECRAWSQLTAHAESWRSVQLRELFGADEQRGAQMSVEAAGVRYDYSRHRVGAITLRLLAHLAEERGFAEWRDALLSGKVVNHTENRPAWHSALRAASPPKEVAEALARMRRLATEVRGGRFRRVVNL